MYLKIFTVEVESFFRPFQLTLEEDRKRTSTYPAHHHQLPAESKVPFPARFLSVLRTGKDSRWIDDQVKVGEEVVESR